MNFEGGEFNPSEAEEFEFEDEETINQINELQVEIPKKRELALNLVKRLGIPLMVLLPQFGLAQESFQKTGHEQEQNQEIDLQTVKENLIKLLFTVEFDKARYLGGDRVDNAELAAGLKEELEGIESFEGIVDIYYEYIRKLDIGCDKDISNETAEYLLRENIAIRPIHGSGKEKDDRFTLFNMSKEGGLAILFNNSDAISFKVNGQDLFIQEEYESKFYYYKVVKLGQGDLVFEEVTQNEYETE